jgi:carbon-monoxide dehydrogenase small subunit
VTVSRADDPPEPESDVSVTLTLNGREVTRTVAAGTLLSTFLREEEFLTSVHRGCESTRCGACTVLLDGEPVKSCNLLAAQVDGTELTTVEGLADDDGSLHPVQQSFWDTHGLQCGYCTPGMVLNAVSLLEETDDPGVNEIRERISGNICRCTGYTKVVESVKNAAADTDADTGTE